MNDRSAEAAPVVVLTLEVMWRRLPLTSTSVWLGDRLRRLAVSVWLAMSLPVWLALYDGTWLAMALIRSGAADCLSMSALTNWIGAGLSVTAMLVLRVPVEMTVI